MRPGRAELLAGLGAAPLAAAVTLMEGFGLEEAGAGAVAGAALALVRVRPRAAWVIAVAASLLVAPGGVSWGVALVVAAHALCAGRWETRWGGVVAAACLIGALEAGVLPEAGSPVPALLLPGAAWGAGRALRGRALVADQLAARVHELEEEREAHAALSVRYERARIASELHDIVAHAISVMVVQAGAGQRLARRDPEATAATFEAIAEAARQAEGDMQRLVALLGDEDAIGQAPDLDLVEELVTRAAGSGLDVTLRLEGQREGFGAACVQTAYRVVQEGLTNALRHSAGARVEVTVTGERDALIVQVFNGPRASTISTDLSGPGNGLRGLRERAAACGGLVEAGPTPDGGWMLSARFTRRSETGTRDSSSVRMPS